MARAKGKKVFVCDQCGNETPKWEGRCSSCGEWNSLGEVKSAPRSIHSGSWLGQSGSQSEELSLVQIDDLSRVKVVSGEMNRVLGGGVVPGSLTMIAGNPGIGKSTLLLQIASDFAMDGGKVVYVSGEESSTQIRIRADRLGISGSHIFLLQTTAVDDVIAHLEKLKPDLAVVDSIQTMYDSRVQSTAGSVTQVRESTRLLMEWAKSRNVPLILTGHVTKGGDIAGPRVLEHMVDVVLYMEGDPIGSWRLLRAIKNRFGSTNEVGVLEMGENGLADVEDPSRAFLSERSAVGVGSVIVPTLEGTRPLLVEIQALTTPSVLQAPRRVATGLDYNRLLMVCAVLTRRSGVSLSNQDVIVNVAGGLRVTEPGADLGIAIAIVSSVRNIPTGPGLAAVGEVGLSGEVRGVPEIERRVTEVSRLRLKTCLIPENNRTDPNSDGVKVQSVATLDEALRDVFSHSAD